MSPKFDEHIAALDGMKKYPTSLFYKGNPELLKCPMVSIVGSRRPTPYTRNFTYALAHAVIYKNKQYSTIINGTIRHANV